MVMRWHLNRNVTVLDWGCGHGKDVEAYSHVANDVFGYDPKFYPTLPNKKYDIITCTYVLNTISHEERVTCLKEAIKYLKPGGKIVVTTRTAKSVLREKKDNWSEHLDGFITCAGTFQKGFEEDELKELMQGVGLAVTEPGFKVTTAAIMIGELILLILIMLLTVSCTSTQQKCLESEHKPFCERLKEPRLNEKVRDINGSTCQYHELLETTDVTLLDLDRCCYSTQEQTKVIKSWIECED